MSLVIPKDKNKNHGRNFKIVWIFSWKMDWRTECDTILEKKLNKIIIKLDQHFKDYHQIFENEIVAQKEIADKLWVLIHKYLFLTKYWHYLRLKLCLDWFLLEDNRVWNVILKISQRRWKMKFWLIFARKSKIFICQSEFVLYFWMLINHIFFQPPFARVVKRHCACNEAFRRRS